MTDVKPNFKKIKKQGLPFNKKQITYRGSSKSLKSRSPKTNRSKSRSPKPKGSKSCKRNSKTLQRSCGSGNICNTGKTHYYQQDDSGKRTRISKDDIDDSEIVKICSDEKLTSESSDFFINQFTDIATTTLYDRIDDKCPQVGTVGTLIQQDKNNYLFVYQNEEGRDVALYVIQHTAGLFYRKIPEFLYTPMSEVFNRITPNMLYWPELDQKFEVWPLNRNWRRGYLIKSVGYCQPERLFINVVDIRESIFQYNNVVLVPLNQARKYPYIVNDNSEQYGHIYYMINTAVEAILNYGQPPELLAYTYDYLSKFSILFNEYIFIKMIIKILNSNKTFLLDRFIISEYLIKQGFIDRTDYALLNIQLS